MKNKTNTENFESSKPHALNLKNRDTYLLERERIKTEIGDLDQIRQTLGLSQRRACKLLLVDPSAWTRWNKTEAPPHIYQALKWLLQLKKTNPETVGPVDLSTRLDHVQFSTQSKIKELEQTVTMLERGLALIPQTIQIQEPSKSEELMKMKIALLEQTIEALLKKKPKLQKKQKRRAKLKNTKRSRLKKQPRKRSKSKPTLKTRRQKRRRR